MRLLNVENLDLQSGYSDAVLNRAGQELWDARPSSSANQAVPKYVILSHRWVGDEIRFEDFPSVPKDQLANVPARNPLAPDSSRNVRGSDQSIYKIAGACREVRNLRATTGQQQPVHHLWIDTFCINKRDAVETSTAINSMFQWYQNAEVCLVYLFDVTWDDTAVESSRRSFAASRWFERGWTLQELLAPREVRFYDRDWRYIGTRGELAGALSAATGIREAHLLGSWRSASLAQKMSWLARRTTTLVEDRAYCMLGIVGVFLDTRYGQGEEEFQRLQREIFVGWGPNSPFDESLFAWRADAVESAGLFAPAPGCFRDCGDLVYERRLAKFRHPRQREMLDSTNTFTLELPISVYIPTPLLCMTCGIPAWFTVVPYTATMRAVREHSVRLNCWTRDPASGRLAAVEISMAQQADKTWRRVDCGRVSYSSILRIFPSMLLGVTSNMQLRVVNQTAYKPRDDQPYHAGAERMMAAAKPGTGYNY
ncbi:hypothetical protein F4778DRAFT_752946 [Xylariomycetidae sp. FL2044]|nr:hypothetical protein F4778DRAFT_752946 [Xylariomycetidae sp. FL2044]